MIEEVKHIAKKAGHAILEFYTQDADIEVDYKSDDSPLTKADLAAHHVIVDGLRELDPTIPIISEESGVPEYDIRKHWNRFWIVDPLDGTKEFIKKNGEFTVNIALVEEGMPVLGVVYLPDKDVLYFGAKGEGSFKEEGGQITRIHSEPADLSKPLTVITSRSHRSDNLEEALKEKGITIGDTIAAGSSLKFCYVAEGRADIYPRMGPTMEWDVAAGDAVYRYSAVKGTHHSVLRYNKQELRNGQFVIGT